MPKDPYIWALEIVDKVAQTVRIEEVVRQGLAIDVVQWCRRREDRDLAADCVNRCVVTRPGGQDVADLLLSAEQVYKIASEQREKSKPGKPAPPVQPRQQRRSRAAERSAKRK